MAFITFLLITVKLNAQNIVGRWQAGSGLLSNEYNENYQFYSNGSFTFNTSGDDGLTRIMKINGTYRIFGNKIFFIAKNYVELAGGFLKFTGAEPGQSNWKFESNSPTTIKIVNQSEQAGSLKLYMKQKSVVLEIEGTRYYKVASDPNKY